MWWNSRLVIEERPGGLEIMTPFIIVENGGELLAGGPESRTGYNNLHPDPDGGGNETSQDRGIDDPQLYSLYDLKGPEYVPFCASTRAAGSRMRKESTLWETKVLARAGRTHRSFGAKGTATPWRPGGNHRRGAEFRNQHHHPRR